MIYTSEAVFLGLLHRKCALGLAAGLELLCIYLLCVFMCGMKDSLRSKTTPKNLVSSTTGTGVPFSSRMCSRWGLRNLQKCMHTVLEGENLNPLVSAQSESLLRHC